MTKYQKLAKKFIKKGVYTSCTDNWDEMVLEFAQWLDEREGECEHDIGLGCDDCKPQQPKKIEKLDEIPIKSMIMSENRAKINEIIDHLK